MQWLQGLCEFESNRHSVRKLLLKGFLLSEFVGMPLAYGFELRRVGGEVLGIVKRVKDAVKVLNFPVFLSGWSRGTLSALYTSQISSALAVEAIG